MRKAIGILSILVLMSACKIYSFSGANINPDIKTISVAYIFNKSGNGPASASDIFTNLLKDKMITNTNLTMTNTNGDVYFAGEISNYNYTIQAPSGNTTSDLRRITMAVTVSYYNRIDEIESFEQKTFTRFADYPVSEDLTAIEETIITEISTQLVDDIFNAAFVKW
ncbi:MAG: hypothetical protein ACI9O4_000562 [Chitinophagales bacterium]|jgi:hypothetical protein